MATWSPPVSSSPRLAGALFVVLAGLLPGAALGGVPWHTNLAGAKAASTVSQRPVLVVFTAAWSEASVNLEATALGSDEAVALLTACYEPVRIDVDADPALQRAMGVSRLPSACVIDQNDRVVARFDIPAAPAAFVAAAGRAAQQAAHSGAFPGPTVTTPPATASGPTVAPAATADLAQERPATVASEPPAAEPSLPTTAPAWPAEKVSRPMPIDGQVQKTTTAPTAPGPAATTPPGNAATALAGVAPATSGTAAATPSAGSWLGQPAPAPPPTQPPAKSLTRIPAWDMLQKSVTGLFKRPVTPAAGTTPQASPATAATTAATAPPPPSVAAAPATPPDDSAPSMPVGLDGYCPVTLMDRGMWAEGRAQWGVRHRGRTYLFAGQAEQQAFLAAPDRYAPGLSGDDPVLALDTGRQVQGQRRYGVTYQSRMYLFSSPETRATFAADPQRYTARVAVAEQPGGDRTITR
jgi:YHS domain-containing protein